MPIKDIFFLKEIEGTDWVIEVIGEKFDNVMEMMTKDTVIYGNVIRDCLASEEVKHTLANTITLAAPVRDYGVIKSRFSTNPKWVPSSGGMGDVPMRKSSMFDKIAEVEADGAEAIPTVQSSKSIVDGVMERLYPSSASPDNKAIPSKVTYKGKPLLKNPYDGSLYPPSSPYKSGKMSVSFRTENGSVVEIYPAERGGVDDFESVLHTARSSVDFTCCGLVMTSDGRIFEILPNAAKDCADGILKINPYFDLRLLNNLGKKVELLKSQGWKSEINVAKEMRKATLILEKQKKKDCGPFADNTGSASKLSSRSLAKKPPSLLSSTKQVVSLPAEMGETQLAAKKEIARLSYLFHKDAILPFYGSLEAFKTVVRAEAGNSGVHVYSITEVDNNISVQLEKYTVDIANTNELMQAVIYRLRPENRPAKMRGVSPEYIGQPDDEPAASAPVGTRYYAKYSTTI